MCVVAVPLSIETRLSCHLIVTICRRGEGGWELNLVGPLSLIIRPDDPRVISPMDGLYERKDRTWVSSSSEDREGFVILNLQPN